MPIYCCNTIADPIWMLYRKWNFDLHTLMVYGNMQEDYTVRKIKFSAGTNIQYKFSKTFASIRE